MGIQWSDLVGNEAGIEAKLPENLIKATKEVAIPCNASKFLPRLSVFILIMIVTACTNYATPEDNRRLKELEKRYGNRFSFVLENETYINVGCKKGVRPDEREVINIYKTFFWDDYLDDKRKGSSYVYMNLYDSNGTFEYQLFYDINERQFMKSRADHY